MKYIKKVSASELVSSTGTIIDSMNPGDDQTVNAPSIHAVKDYVEDNVENYSTTEQRIGTWMGKPLYRKTINIGTLDSSNATSTFTTTVTDMSELVDAKAKIWIADSTNDISFILPYELASNVSNYVNCGIDNNKSDLFVRIRRPGASYWSGRNVIVTIKYTKSTD